MYRISRIYSFIAIALALVATFYASVELEKAESLPAVESVEVAVCGTLNRPLSLHEYQRAFSPDSDVRIARVDTYLYDLSAVWLKGNFEYLNCFPLQKREKREVKHGESMYEDILYRDMLNHQLSFVDASVPLKEDKVFEIFSIKERTLAALQQEESFEAKQFAAFAALDTPKLLVVDITPKVLGMYADENAAADRIAELLQPLFKANLHAIAVYGLPLTTSYTYKDNVIVFAGGNIGDATGISIPKILITKNSAKTKW